MWRNPIGPEYYLANSLMLAASDLRQARYWITQGRLKMAMGCAQCADILLKTSNDNDYFI